MKHSRPVLQRALRRRRLKSQEPLSKAQLIIRTCILEARISPGPNLIFKFHRASTLKERSQSRKASAGCSPVKRRGSAEAPLLAVGKL